MKLPLDGKWTIDQEHKRGLGLLATKNIDFDEQGFATLANRTISLFDTGDDANFTAPIAAYSSPSLTKIAGTSGYPYSISINTMPTTIASDSGVADAPALSSNSSQAFFNSKWFVSETADLNSMTSGGVWTDETVSWTSGVRHPLCVHKANNTLLVGNGPGVKQYDTSVSPGTALVIGAGVEVVGIAYNRAFAAVITWDALNHEAWLYIWDAATAAANYAYPLGSNRAEWVVPYKDTFVCMTGLGQLLKWATGGLEQLAALPIFYTTAQLGSIDTRLDITHDTGVLVDGNKILFNIKPQAAYKASEPDQYNPLMPGGTWCYDPAVGLYHRHAPSGTKLLYATTINPNLTTNLLTLSGSDTPETGTPFVYASTDGNVIDPLVIGTTYYVIRVSTTAPATMRVATSRTNALAGTAVDLTGDHSAFAYRLWFFPESDFGQQSCDMYGGLLTKTGPPAANANSSAFSIFQKYAYGFKNVMRHSTGDALDSFGIVMDRSENRGWMITQVAYAANVKDKLQKLYVKARHIFTDLDKVIVKYRVAEDLNMPIFVQTDSPSGATSGLWASATSFTTGANLAAAKTAFDAGHAYEVEITSGAGAGYLAHIASISLAAGTYTVGIDESVRNIVVGDAFTFIVDNWEKLMTKGGAAGIDYTSDPDYSEFPIGRGAGWVQLKFELRGYRVKIAEYQFASTDEKPSA